MAGQMFMVVATSGADKVRVAVEKLGAETYYELKSDTWLILFDGTTRKLSEEIGIRNGTNGSGVVAAIAGYSGRASSELWEWLKVKWPIDG